MEVDKSRLYKILVSEREGEVIEESVGSKERSAFKSVKKSLCRKLSFSKVGKNKNKKSEEVQSLFPTEQEFSLSSKQGKTRSAFQKVTDTFRNSFRRNSKIKKRNSIESPVHDSDEDIPSGRDSAYFSLTQSCTYERESDTLQESEEANNSFDYFNTISRSSSFNTSPIPILTTNSLTRKVPKKSVTLLLPKTRTRKKPFGVHLQTENVSIIHKDYEESHHHHGNISSQVRNIQYQAKCDLLEKFPSLSTTINLLFSDNLRPLLLSLSSSLIGDLVFQLRTVLFSPLLLMVQSWDVVLCVCIRFLHQVSLILQSVENCQHFHQVWVELQDKCKKCFYQHQVECLTEVRAAYIDMWCKMVEAE